MDIPAGVKYVGLLFFEYVGCLVWAFTHKAKDDPFSLDYGYVSEIADTAEPLMIVATALTVVVMEGGTMLAESFKRHEREKGREEGSRETADRLFRLAEQQGVDVKELRRAYERDKDGQNGRNANAA